MPEPIRDAASATTYHGFSAVPAAKGVRAERPQRGRQVGLALGAAALAGALAWFVSSDDPSALHRPPTLRPTPAHAAASLAPAAEASAAAPPAPTQILPVEAAPVAASPARRRAVAARVAHPARTRLAAQPALRPEFHCDWRLRRSERMICGDARLSQLDRQLNHAYGQALRAGAPRSQLRRAQDAWVMRREAHARSPATLAAYYRQRIRELAALAHRRGHG